MEGEPFTTGTMAELYIRQGHIEKGIAVYRALLEQQPGDPQLQCRLNELLADTTAKGVDMGFREHLEKVMDGTEGGLVCAIMGNDGIAIDSITREGDSNGVDVASILVEYAGIIGQMRKSAEILQSGALQELAITSERVGTIMRPVTDEYFVGLTMSTQGNMGKGRYLLRVVAPYLAAEL